ncbi:MAG: HlyD family efflux transporter periplasmic adaptor subunit [Bacteroidota bacterium]
MKRLAPFVQVLTTITVSLFLVGCSATIPEESASTPTTIPEPATKEALLKKTDLNLMEVKNEVRTMITFISGRVIPKNTTQLFAEVQGTIEPTGKTFKAGVNFKKGETLIQINSKEFELNLEAQRASLLNILTGILADLKSDYPDSYDEWLSYVEDYSFTTTLAEMPEPKSSAEKFFLTGNQVYSLYYQIKASEERMKKYLINAPYNGTITATNVDVGSLVAPGQPLGTISNSWQYELEAGVPLKIASQLKSGDPITFRSNEVEGTWTGRVVRINSLVDPSTQNIPVYFSLRGQGLRAGMYLEGELTADKVAEVTVIPNSAIGRDESVLILQQDLITRKSIQPIDFLSDSIVVRGLKNEDLVILNEFEMPVEGSRVDLN